MLSASISAEEGCESFGSVTYAAVVEMNVLGTEVVVQQMLFGAIDH